MHCPSLTELPSPPLGKTGWPWTEETPQLPDVMPDGSKWPLISIVTPSYNQAHYIEETIRAVLLQGYPNLEYVIIDGESTDGSVEIIKKYEPFVTRWVSEKDKGQYHAINKGFQLCCGDIITWVSSDDVYLPHAFRKVALLKPRYYDHGAIVGSFHFVDEHSTVDEEIHLPRLPFTGAIDLSVTSPTEWRLHQVSTFYIRHALDALGRFVREDLRDNSDRELLYRIARKYKILLVEDALAAFRFHYQSKSGSVSNIIAMARDYAAVQYLFFTENPKDNARRKRIAKYHIAKGYAKYAKYSSSIFNSVFALNTALFYQPRFIIDRDYIIAWLTALRILPFLKWLRQNLYS